MPVGHKVVNDLPIIITVMNGIITFDDVLSNCKFVDNYLKDNKLNKVYWILDAVTINYSRGTAIKIAEATKSGLAGSGGDPRVTPLVVISKERYAHIDNALKNRHVNLEYPAFDTMKNACNFALYLTRLDNPIRNPIR